MSRLPILPTVRRQQNGTSERAFTGRRGRGRWEQGGGGGGRVWGVGAGLGQAGGGGGGAGGGAGGGGGGGLWRGGGGGGGGVAGGGWGATHLLATCENQSLPEDAWPSGRYPMPLLFSRTLRSCVS